MIGNQANSQLNPPNVASSVASLVASLAYVARVLGTPTFLLSTDALNETQANEQSANQSADQGTSKTINSSTESVFVAGQSESELAFVGLHSAAAGVHDELLDKMIVAMKQDPARVLRIGLRIGAHQAEQVFDLLQSHPRRVVVVLGEGAARELLPHTEFALAQWLEPRPHVPVLVTYGLDELQSHTDLKRQTWLHLQMAMKRFGS